MKDPRTETPSISYTISILTKTSLSLLNFAQKKFSSASGQLQSTQEISWLLPTIRFIWIPISMIWCQVVAVVGVISVWKVGDRDIIYTNSWLKGGWSNWWDFVARWCSSELLHKSTFHHAIEFIACCGKIHPAPSHLSFLRREYSTTNRGWNSCKCVAIRTETPWSSHDNNYTRNRRG